MSTVEPKTGALTPARAAAFVAVLLAVAVVGFILLRGGDTYEITARIQNASQLVPGNLVQVGGRKAGTVEELKLTDDGIAEITLRIDEDYAPLKQGTTANIRIASLSGVANRYVDLIMPAGDPPDIPDGGALGPSATTAQVDIDQLFNTFDNETRRGLQRFVRGNAELYEGMGLEQNQAWEYLNPSTVAATRLFAELNEDPRTLRRFVVENAQLVTDLAEKRDDLARLIDRLATGLGAIAAEDENLTRAIGQLPPFMRRANTTFVNLRATLDDLDPLIEETRPVAPLLREFLGEIRPFAEDARPTIRDLSRIVRSPGEDNDLIELGRSVIPFRNVAIRGERVNGERRDGSFETSQRSLDRQTPIWRFQRPYAVDLTGWFDDFSHSGLLDANGNASRVATTANAFTTVAGVLTPVPQALRDVLVDVLERDGTILRQNNRCPGSIERSRDGQSLPLRPSPDFECDPTQRPVGR